MFLYPSVNHSGHRGCLPLGPGGVHPLDTPPDTQTFLLPPANEVCEGYVLSVYRGRVCPIACWDTPPGTRGRHPPGRHPPARCMLGYTPLAQCMLGYGQQAGGTHPTGMHSCYRPQTKFVKVMFCLSTGGVSAPLHAGIHPLGPEADTPLGRHPPARCMLGYTPPSPVHAGIHTPLPSACWDTPPLRSACWDTVNKRAVRIPLECILVIK